MPDFNRLPVNQLHHDQRVSDTLTSVLGKRSLRLASKQPLVAGKRKTSQVTIILNEENSNGQSH
jgi:hypothetical protein